MKYSKPRPRSSPLFPAGQPWRWMSNSGNELPLNPVTMLHSNPWFSVYNRGGYYTVEEPCMNIIILPVIDMKTVVLVRPYRPVLQDAPLELPAGKTKSGENPNQCAVRELKEETGIWIQDQERLVPQPSIATSANRNPALTHVFRVDISHREYENREQHDSEIYSVETLTFPQLSYAIIQGEVYLSSPIAVLARFLLMSTGD